jgi:V8-like Glu-specific endopeptidase
VYPDAGAESYATGTLIGPNLLLTCSHAIQKKPDGNMWWTQFFPAQNGAQTPFPPARVTKAWRVVWVNPDNPDANMAGLDFAVMVLDKPVGKDLGFWDVAPYQPAFLKEVWGHLGYPGTLNGKATFQGGISIEKAVPLNYGGYPGLMLGTDCDQEHGQSGGPLYRMNNGKPFIIGVLHGDPHNFGVRSVFSSGTALTNLVDWARKQPA